MGKMLFGHRGFFFHCNTVRVATGKKMAARLNGFPEGLVIMHQLESLILRTHPFNLVALLEGLPKLVHGLVG